MLLLLEILEKLHALQVWEARRGTLPKDGRVMFELEQHGPRETIEDRTVWLTYGTDLVSVNNYYLVAEDIEMAKVNNFILVILLYLLKFNKSNPSG